MTEHTPLAVIVAVKQLDQAKSRLRPLGDRWREALVMAMLDDVLAAVGSAEVGPVTLVSADASYDALAARHGVTRVVDASEGYNAAVVTALGLPAVATAGAVLIIPADMPTLRGSDMAALRDSLRETDVLLVPSPDGGTAVLGLRPPGVMPTTFGPDSAARHRVTAAACGLRLLEPSFPHLVDVDEVAVLRGVADRVGPATAGVLDELVRSEQWPRTTSSK